MSPRILWLLWGLGILTVSCGESNPRAGTYSPGQSSKVAAPAVVHEGLDASSQIVVPSLKFDAANVPSKESDAAKLSLEIKADPSFSHYAYKLGVAKDCSTQGGYFVSEINKPIVVNQEVLPFGPVYLCMIGYHGGLKTWQRIADAKVYTWQKVPFRRTIKGYYEFNSSQGQCQQPSIIRGTMTMNIEGDRGNYVFSVTFPPTCPGAINQTGVVSLVSIKTTETKLIATSIDNGFIGWVDLNFTNLERTQFQGTWGMNTALGSNPMGPLNSTPE